MRNFEYEIDVCGLQIFLFTSWKNWSLPFGIDWMKSRLFQINADWYVVTLRFLCFGLMIDYSKEQN